MNKVEFLLSQEKYKPNVPTIKIKGENRIKIEIDDTSSRKLGYETRRINITCFDFQLEETLKLYKNKNPKIISDDYSRNRPGI